MKMDSVSLGTLASWLSDCKVGNETILEGIKVEKDHESLHHITKANEKPQIWNPWASGLSKSSGKCDTSQFNDSHQKIKNFEHNGLESDISFKSSSEIENIQQFNAKMNLEWFNNASPYQDMNKSTSFNQWDYPVKEESIVSSSDNFVLSLKNKNVQKDQISCSGKQTLSSLSFGSSSDNKCFHSKVPEMPTKPKCHFVTSKHLEGVSSQGSSINIPRPSFDEDCSKFGISKPEEKFVAGKDMHFEADKSDGKSDPSNSQSEGKCFERLVLNQIEEFPRCNCRVPRPYDEALDGPFYTQLGVAGSIPEVREMIRKRLNIRDNELRLEKVVFTGKEGKSSQGCPIAKWIIRRSSLKEKVLVLIRQIRHHYCSSSVMVIGICLWDGLPEDHATELYDYLRITLPKYGEATERRCATNERKTCACQGWNESSGGASFSFGCSWSMYYNGCKFARSSSPKKFHLKNNSEEELILEHHLQTLATTVAPIYQKVAPTSFKNQTMFESVASSCRLGYKPGRPWSGVTAVVDFCTHSHKDFNNMNNGCTTVLTLTKHRGLEKPEDEQLHVLPLCVLDSTDEFGSREGLIRKMQSGALECLNSFPSVMRIRATPYMCKRKQRLAKASLKKKICWNGFGSLVRKYKKTVPLPQKSYINKMYNYAPILRNASMHGICLKSREASKLADFTSSNQITAKSSSTVLPAFSQFVSSLSNFRKFRENDSNLSPRLPAAKSDWNYFKVNVPITNRNCSEPYSTMKGNSIKCEINMLPSTIPSASNLSSHLMPQGITSVNEKWSSQFNLNDPSDLRLHLTNPDEESTATFPNVSNNVLSGHLHSYQNVAPAFPESLPHFTSHKDVNKGEGNFNALLLTNCNSSGHIDKKDENLKPQVEQKLEIFTNNCDVFQDGGIGGVAIALTHGSLLFEVAKRELHATTALKHPDRSQPTRMSLVFYQHKSLNRAHHGRAEYEKKLKEKREKKLEEMTLASQKCLQEEPTFIPDIKIEREGENMFSSGQHQNDFNFRLWALQQHSNSSTMSGNIKRNDNFLLGFPKDPSKESNHQCLHEPLNDLRWQKAREGMQVKVAQGPSDRYSHADGAVGSFLSSFVLDKKH